MNRLNPLKISCKITCLGKFFWGEIRHLPHTLPGDPQPLTTAHFSIVLPVRVPSELLRGFFAWVERGDGLQHADPLLEGDRAEARPSWGILGVASSSHLVGNAGTVSPLESSSTEDRLHVPSHCSIPWKQGTKVGCQGSPQPMFPWRDRNQRWLLPWKPCWQQ